jgi:RNA polymerase sigma-70 factor (ECF subfamily)
MKRIVHPRQSQEPAEGSPAPEQGAASPTDAQTQSDAELVRGVLQKDRKATAEFVSRYADAIHAFVRRRLLPRTDLVDDVVQDVFVAALGSLASFAGVSSLRAWLVGIARHKVEDYYRECLRQPAPLPVLNDEENPPRQPAIEFEEVLDRASRQRRVLRVLTELPPAYRAALLWRYWDQQSARDMAAKTGKSEKAIERLLARARHEFRRRWNEG